MEVKIKKEKEYIMRFSLKKGLFKKFVYMTNHRNTKIIKGESFEDTIKFDSNKKNATQLTLEEAKKLCSILSEGKVIFENEDSMVIVHRINSKEEK